MLLPVILIAAFVAPIIAIDWCSLKCNSGTHTMCKYKHLTQTNGCQDIKDIQTQEDRQRILDLHNEYRNELAGGKTKGWPEAANMRKMDYDITLEQVALRWAVQCIVGHDQCRNTPTFGYVGQNYYMMGGSMSMDPASTTKPGFDAWVNEISLASKSLVSSYEFGAGFGHFTQVIWAKTFKLGCGKISYKKHDWNHHVLICNYGPGGNMMRAPMYIAEKACSKCPQGTSCIEHSPYPNLCSSGRERNSVPAHSATPSPSPSITSAASRGIQDSLLNRLVQILVELLYQLA